MEEYERKTVVLKVYIMSHRNLRWTLEFIGSVRCQRISNN